MDLDIQTQLVCVLIIQGLTERGVHENFLGEGYEISFADTIGESKGLIGSKEFDIVLLDLDLPDYQGIDALKSLLRELGSIPVVIMLQEGDDELGMEAMHLGAQDYLHYTDLANENMLKRIIRYSIERNKHIKALKIQEDSLKLAQEISKIGSWTWYPESDNFIPSAAFIKIFEIPELTAQNSFITFLRNVHVDDRQKIKEALHDHTIRLESFSLEFRIYTKTKKLRHIQLRGNLLEETGQLEPVYYGTGQDITELKSTVENLNQKERFLDLSGEIAQVGGWEFDLIEEKLYWSKASYTIHGVPEAFQPSFEAALEFYKPEEGIKMSESFYKSIAENKPIFLEAPINRDGEIRWLQYNGRIIYENSTPVKVAGVVHDITESKRNMKKQELRGMMLDNVKEAAMAVDKNWNVIFWNKAAEDLFGYKRSETINQPLASFNILKISKVKFTKDFEKFKKGKNVTGEYTLVTRQGREFPGFASSSVIIGQEGKIEALVTIIRDISKEKEHLLKLEQSETRFRKLFEHSALGIGLVDMNSKKWLDSNDTLLKLLGYSKEEFLNLTYVDITPREFLKVDHEEFHNPSSKNTFGPYQKEYIKKDGSRVKVILTGFIIENEDDSKLAWTHVLDITELEEKTESLRQSDERFRDYVENSTDVILTIDENGVITYISPNAKNVFGFDYTEIKGFSLLEFSHPDEKVLIAEDISAAFNNDKGILKATSRIMHKEGYYLWIQSEGTVRTTPEGKKYGIIVSRDIDKERRSELQVREQNRKLKDIAFIQSHILRRPLANILGLLAMNTLSDNMPLESVRLLNLIRKEAETMDDIVYEIVEKSTELTNLPSYE